MVLHLKENQISMIRYRFHRTLFPQFSLHNKKITKNILKHNRIVKI